MGDVLTAEEDLAAGDRVAGIAHQGGHQGGLAGAVVTHQNVGLAGTYRQIQAVQQNLLLLTDRHL